MGFHEVRFPASLSFGSVGGPERRTEIVTLVNGFEERNSPWAHSRRRYDAGLGLRSLEDVEALIAFFEARRGQLFGFRWKDWADYRSCAATATVTALDQVVGTGDGVRREFPLAKTYRSGEQTYVRPIAKPVAGSVRVALSDVPLVETIDFDVDVTTGLLKLQTAPAIGAVLTAGFEFDVPVRFDTDHMAVTIETYRLHAWQQIPIVELRT
jgi:uncharacterized protein (TIGR02217 family)